LFNDNNLFKDENIPRKKIRRLEKKVKPQSYWGTNRKLWVLIILMDRIRDDAGKTVDFSKETELKRLCSLVITRALHMELPLN
jgi:hypothetical protein